MAQRARSRLFLAVVLLACLWLTAGLPGCRDQAVSEHVESAQQVSEAVAAPSKTKSPPQQAPAPQVVQGAERSETPPAAGPTRAAAEERVAGAKVAPVGTCEGMCERTVSLGCGSRDACMANCVSMLEAEADLCAEHMQAFLACALSRPSGDWECTQDKVAAVKDGVCDKEQNAFVTCAQQAAVRR